MIGLATGSPVAELLVTKGSRGTSGTDSMVSLRHDDAASLAQEKLVAQSDAGRRLTAPDLNKPLPSISPGAARPYSWEV